MSIFFASVNIFQQPNTSIGGRSKGSSNENDPLSFPSLVSWAGSTIAFLSILSGAHSLPHLPRLPWPLPNSVPLQPPQAGSASQSFQSHPILPPLPLPGSSEFDFESVNLHQRADGAKQRFKSYASEFKLAIDRLDIEQAIAALIGMNIEVNEIQDGLKARAIASIYAKSDQVLDVINDAIVVMGEFPISRGSAMNFHQLLQQLGHERAGEFAEILELAVLNV